MDVIFSYLFFLLISKCRQVDRNDINLIIGTWVILLDIVMLSLTIFPAKNCGFFFFSDLFLTKLR